MSSSRSCDGPGRFSSGLWDIQHRASGTLQITPSRCECEGVEERGTQLGGELSDAGARDAPIGAQEQHRFLVGVEPGLELARAVADDDDIGIVVAGPVQLGQRPRRQRSLAPNAFQFANASSPRILRGLLFQHSTANQPPSTSSNSTSCCVSGIDPGLDEQRADRRIGAAAARSARRPPARSAASA